MRDWRSTGDCQLPTQRGFFADIGLCTLSREGNQPGCRPRVQENTEIGCCSCKPTLPAMLLQPSWTRVAQKLLRFQAAERIFLNGTIFYCCWIISFLGESEISGIFCSSLFGFFFQVAALMVDPFRALQPGFSLLRSQSYWCSLSCQKRPFLSSWQQSGDWIKWLVAVLSPPAKAVTPAGLGSWKLGTSPSRNPDAAQDTRAGSQALAELCCRSPTPRHPVLSPA